MEGPLRHNVDIPMQNPLEVGNQGGTIEQRGAGISIHQEVDVA